MTKTYELVVLLTPEYTEQDVQSVQEKISSLVKKVKGTVVSTDVWGKKPLAYTIKKHNEAWYIMFVLDLDTSSVTTVDREISLQNDIIRHLIVIKETAEVSKSEVQALVEEVVE